MNYAETKKQIYAIRNKNEVMFRMAISHLMDVGIRHLTEENIAKTCAEIMKEDDSRSFMTNEYKCALVKTAGELAKLDHIHVLTYISRDVVYDVGDGEVSYREAIGLLNRCMEWIDDNSRNSMETYDTMQHIGFTDDELEQLGYGYIIQQEDEE